MNHFGHSILAIGLMVNSICAASVTLAQDASFDDLPTEVKDYVVRVRDLCVARGSGSKTYDDPMQGITAIRIDEQPAWMVDDERLCNEAARDANCDDSGCDLKIWSEVGRNRWKTVFDEHVLRNFPSVDEQTNKLSVMVIALTGDDDRCKRPPDQSCEFMVSYSDGRWRWNLVH